MIIQQINITPINRQTQDISKWRQALTSSESRNPSRTVLYDLLTDILLDPHLSSVIDKRKLWITNSTWQFVRNGKPDDAITALISQPWFNDMLKDILDAVFWGHSLLEFSYLNGTGAYTLIPRKHVEPTTGIIKKNQSDSAGMPYREPPINKYVFEVGNSPYQGLLVKAAPYVIYKRGGFGDWAQFSEIFGMPFRKGKYDGYDENARQKLMLALQEMGSASFAVIPEGTDIEIMQNNANSGSNVTYKDFKDACNAEISKLILGNTLTTEQGANGARSLGEVHQDVEGMIHQADVMMVRNVLNFPFKAILTAHGISVDNGEFIRVENESVDLDKRILIDKTLMNDMKLPISHEYLYETYGIPKPDNYEELVAGMNEPAPQPVAPPEPEPTPVPAKKDMKAMARLLDMLDFFSARR